MVVQSHSDISNIKPTHLLRYELAAGTRFFSAAPAQLDTAADTPMALIHRGEVTTRSKLKWSSVLMGLHSVFVFLGWQNLGRSGLAFSFGLPWLTKACVVLARLVALRGQTAISRQQALDAYADELQATNFSAVPLWRLLAWFSVPRSGWEKG